MCGIEKSCVIGWSEPLPDKCPPRNARDPTGETLYRLLETDVIQAPDFWSHRKRGKHTGTYPECFARAVSVFSNLGSIRKIRNLAFNKNKRIARVAPTKGQGAVSPPDEKSHISWWPCGAIDPVPMASMVNENDNA